MIRWYRHPKKKKIHVIERRYASGHIVVTPLGALCGDHYSILCTGEVTGWAPLQPPTKSGWEYVRCPNPPHGLRAQVCRRCLRRLGNA